MRRLSTLYSRCGLAALRMLTRCSDLGRARQPGQGLVEYGLILVLIMVVCVAILGTVGQTLSSVWYTKLLPAFS